MSFKVLLIEMVSDFNFPTFPSFSIHLFGTSRIAKIENISAKYHKTILLVFLFNFKHSTTNLASHFERCVMIGVFFVIGELDVGELVVLGYFTIAR